VAARAWVLNLDADLELEKGPGYSRPRVVDERMKALVEEARHLLSADDVLVGEGASAAGLEGRAFCMTPLARRALVDAGAVPVAAPPVEVLRRVNHRRFCAELGQELEGATFATSIDAVRAAVADIDSPGGALLKRPFGFAGRGQRRVRQELTDEDLAWVAASPIAEGVQVEPRVEIIVETSVHGTLVPNGTLARREVAIQRCEGGVWRGSHAPREGELDDETRARALSEAERVGRALAEAGYFGPFGVDGFVYLDARGERRFQPRSEINARYTMGWSLPIV
jgi:hypothetical protein